MNEKNSRWLDFSLKVIIAVLVPVTVAVIGLVSEMIISKAGENQQNLERIARQAEAHTAFRRDLFAVLFTKYVDEISVAEKPQDLDALATRLELLSSNFSDFLNLQPLFQQLSHQIDAIYPVDVQDEEQKILNHIYKDRLVYSARQVIEGQAASIEQRGETYYLYLTRENYQQSLASKSSKIPFEDVTIDVLSVDWERRQVSIRLVVYRTGKEGIGDHSVLVDRTFYVDQFSFPLENNTVLSDNHRLAVSVAQFTEFVVELRVQLFRHMDRYNLDAVYEQSHVNLERVGNKR